MRLVEADKYLRFACAPVKICATDWVEIVAAHMSLLFLWNIKVIQNETEKKTEII